MLESNFSEYGYKAPSARKTGTTIAGIVYKVSTTTLSGQNIKQWQRLRPAGVPLTTQPTPALRFWFRCAVGKLQAPVWAENVEKVESRRAAEAL